MRRFGEGKGGQLFLKSEHLANGQGGYRVAHVTIEDVAFHEWDEDNAYSLGFVGKQARLRLNKTNEAAIIAMFGEPDTTGCTSDPEYAQRMTALLRGKRLTIWVDPFVSFQGKMVPGLRIRPYEGGNSQRPAVETRAEEAFGSQAAQTEHGHEADMRYTQPPTPGGEPPPPEQEFAPSAPVDDSEIPF